MNKCLKCNRELSTADFNGICSNCRGESYNSSSTPLVDIQEFVYSNFEPYWKTIGRQLNKMKRRKIYERKAKRSGIK